MSLHAVHEETESLDHAYHLNQGILLFTGIVVACGLGLNRGRGEGGKRNGC